MPVEVGLGANAAGLKTGLDEARGLLDEFKEEYGGALASGFSELVSAGVLTELAARTIEYGSHLEQLHERFDVSTTDLQRFGLEASKNDVQLDTLAMAFNRLEVARAKALDGNEKDLEAFAHLGITLRDLREDSPEQLMLKIGSSSMDAADMVTVLGRNAMELGPTLEKLSSDGADFGAAMDQNVIKKLDEMSSTFKDLQNTLSVGGGMVLAHTAAPLIEQYKAGMEEFSRTVSNGDYLGALSDIVFAGPLSVGYGGKAIYDSFQPPPTGDDGVAAPGSKPPLLRGGDDATLRDRLNAIDAEAAEKRKSIEDQITDERAKQVDLQAQYEQAQDPEDQAAVLKEAEETERRIGELQAEADRAHEESVRRTNEERERAERDYLREKEESDRKLAEQAIELAGSPEEKRKIINDQLDAAKHDAEQAREALEYLQTVPGADPGNRDKDIADWEKRLAAAQDREISLNRDLKEMDKPARTERAGGDRGFQVEEMAASGWKVAANYDYGQVEARTSRQRIERATQETARNTGLLLQRGTGGRGDNRTYATFGAGGRY